ncbi:YagK/YfjJ domain-containing protein [Acinetobacter populi]|uniref:YagK/YfjJ C-terminal domain-containing protein n=1 Tax=Acinetobacter populi TaxID=1582270 RepID=A0A1Z9Z257_9GAMM|nr:inovirus-type Gp2 protein [Acinetobacter populi]OUY08544.1 hypothetical protein CAP51_02710 [Acinetobacter populi]
MKKPQLLDNSSGTFTIEEQIACVLSDLSSTIIAEDAIKCYLLKYKIDHTAKICVETVSLMTKCEKAQLPIVQIAKATFYRHTQHYRIVFTPGWELLEKKMQSALYHQFTEQYFYSEEIKAWIFVRNQLTENELEILSNRSSLDFTNKDSIQKYTDLFNIFIGRLIKHIQSTSYKKKIRDRNRIKKNNKKACVELLNHLIAKFARVMVVRIDFSLKRDIQTILKHASTMGIPYSRNDLCALKGFMSKFKNNWRNNDQLKGIEGYIFQYEYSHATGFHIHCYFFFDGSKHQEDISIAQYISDYWKKITINQGSSYICNMNKNQYRYCGIGMIHYSEIEKQSFLIKTFDYICKADQFFIFSELKKFKRFQRSKLPIPKAKSGRSRTLNTATKLH